jgi:hypothetical protein
MSRDSESGSTDEIEITPAMAEAGVAALRSRDVFDVFAKGTLEAIACEVFEAMQGIRVSRL